jgi:DNA-directed RNA polymerase specialized sigma24 family protein
MVEGVMREMFKPYPDEYRVLQAYYGERMSHQEIAKELGINESTVINDRLPMAERIFAEQLAESFKRKQDVYNPEK